MSSYVPMVGPLSRADIEAQALEVVSRHYPYLLRKPGKFPVLDFFDHVLRDDYGLDPCVKAMSDGVEGMAYPNGMVILSEATYRAAHQENGRARFTVSHEAYHGLFHRHQIRRVLVHSGELVLHRRQSIPKFRDPEWQANAFASALLMPEWAVREVADRTQTLYRISVMGAVFGVSSQAAQIRLEKLGIM
jgi:hypothetical protein